MSVTEPETQPVSIILLYSTLLYFSSDRCLEQLYSVAVAVAVAVVVVVVVIVVIIIIIVVIIFVALTYTYICSPAGKTYDAVGSVVKYIYL